MNISERLNRLITGLHFFVRLKVFYFLLFLFFVSSESSFCFEDISQFYISKGIKYVFSGGTERAVDSLRDSYEISSSDLPVEIELKAPLNAPIVEKIEFEYPRGISESRKIDLVEAWVESDYELKYFNQVFKGRMVSEGFEDIIEIEPVEAKVIYLRMFSSAGDEAPVIPQIRVYGRKDSDTPDYPANIESGSWKRILNYNGVPFGELFVERKKAADGYEYEINSMSLVEEYEGEEFQIKTQKKSCEIKTGLDMAVSEFNCKMENDDVKSSGNGSNGYFDFHFSRKGEDAIEFSRTFHEDKIYFLPTLYDKLILDGLCVGVEKTYPVLDYMTGNLISVNARITNRIDSEDGEPLYFVWLYDDDHRYVESLSVFKNDGAVLRSFDLGYRVDYALVDDEEEIELDAYRMNTKRYLEKTIEQIKNSIREPNGVTSSRIKIRWNEVNPEFLSLEGGRQRLIGLEEVEPGVFEAELNIQALHPGDDGLVRDAPLSPEEMDSYLLYDDAVLTENEKLIELANEIAGDEEDPLEISRLIFNWVIANIYPGTESSYFAPDSKYILETKQGDCKHHAIMFASLARALGISTRFAMGRRYLGGSFGYHVWNQIYIDGQWIDIDATDVAMYPGALHVQLLTSASFNEFAHIGVLLGLNTEPEILEYEESTPSFDHIESKYETIQEKNYYQDGFFKIRVGIPDGLQYDRYDYGIVRKIGIEDPEEPDFYGGIYAFLWDEDVDFSWDQFAIANAIPDLMLVDDSEGDINKKGKVLKSGKTTLNGYDGFFIQYQFVNGDNDFWLIELTYIKAKNNIVAYFFCGPSEVLRNENRNMEYIKKNTIFLEV